MRRWEDERERKGAARTNLVDKRNVRGHFGMEYLKVWAEESSRPREKKKQS